MKRNFTLCSLLTGLILSSLNVNAQVYYNFETDGPTSNSYTNITAAPITVGNNNGTTTLRTTTSPSSGYTGASGVNNASAATRNIGFDPATTTYFQTTLTPANNASVLLSGISFGSFSTSTGPTAITVRTSVDNFATDQATFIVLANSTWALLSSSISVTGLAGAPVVVRIYGFNGTGAVENTATWRIDDLTFNPTNIVPLNLTSFNASFNGKISELKWSTVNESNIKGFSIEKSSNGSEYREVAFIAANNTASQNNYSLDDANLGSGSNFYRIKIISNDGSVKYSNIVVINNKQSIKAELFPNPVIANVTVTHSKANAGAVIRVLNIAGKQIKTYAVQAGAVQSALSVSELIRGNYVLIFENHTQKSIIKFSKQ